MKRFICFILALFLAFVMPLGVFADDCAPTSNPFTGEELLLINSLFGIGINQCDSVSSISESSTSSSEDVSLRYDSNRLVKISFFQNPDLESEQLVSTSSAINFCTLNLPAILSLFDISDNWEFVSSHEIDTRYLFLTFEKRLSNDLMNPLQSINLCFDRYANCLSVARIFCCEPNALAPFITSQTATEIASLAFANKFNFDSVYLTYVNPSNYLNTSQKYIDDTAYLVYVVSDNNIHVIIDALSGDIIGFDDSLSGQSRCYTIKESVNESDWGYRYDISSQVIIDIYNQYRLDNINLASSAFTRLGYNNSLSGQYSSSSINLSMKQYVAGSSNEYALYFCGHGSETSLGFKSKTILTTSDVSGNWHFVFLDGCSTAVSNSWASAFNIDGYSNRAFLGWSNTVTLSNTHKFNQAFWPMLDGNITVRQAAVDAAAEVEGAGTTPIRFYGDRTYTGKAWS